jgi:hypothetical protein
VRNCSPSFRVRSFSIWSHWTWPISVLPRTLLLFNPTILSVSLAALVSYDDDRREKGDYLVNKCMNRFPCWIPRCYLDQLGQVSRTRPLSWVWFRLHHGLCWFWTRSPPLNITFIPLFFVK